MTDASRWRLKTLAVLASLLALVLGFGSRPPAPGAWSACAFQRWLGIPCPACGVLRSIDAAWHLDISGSVAEHPLGPLLAAGLIAGLMWFALAALFGKRWPVAAATEMRLLVHADRMLLGSLLVTWVVRLGGMAVHR